MRQVIQGQLSHATNAKTRDEKKISTLELLTNMYKFLSILRVRGPKQGDDAQPNVTRRQLLGRVNAQQKARLKEASPDVNHSKVTSKVAAHASPTVVTNT